MLIEENLPLLEEILSEWKTELGQDYQAYKNHLYRMIHFCFALHVPTDEDQEKIIIAACFHDLGIWTNNTFDYLPPSILLAKKYLEQRNLDNWFPEISLMIDMHHKLRKFNNHPYPLVEIFRKADLVDVSLGIVKFDIPKEHVAKVKNTFPDHGFHIRLVQLTARQFTINPLKPLPMMKW